MGPWPAVVRKPSNQGLPPSAADPSNDTVYRIAYTYTYIYIFLIYCSTQAFSKKTCLKIILLGISRPALLFLGGSSASCSCPTVHRRFFCFLLLPLEFLFLLLALAACFPRAALFLLTSSSLFLLFLLRLGRCSLMRSPSLCRVPSALTHSPCRRLGSADYEHCDEHHDESHRGL